MTFKNEIQYFLLSLDSSLNDQKLRALYFTMFYQSLSFNYGSRLFPEIKQCSHRISQKLHFVTISNLLRSNVFLRLFFFTDRSECPFVAFRRIWTLHHPCHPLNPNSLEWQIHCYTAGPDSLGIKNQRAINTMLKSYSKYGFLPQ